MRNKRFFIVLVGALIFGVLAAVSVSKYLSSAQAYSKNLNNVAVAKVAIPIGSKIVAEQIMVVQFPKESTPDGAFESAEKLAGRVAVINIVTIDPEGIARQDPISKIVLQNIKVLASGQNIDKPKDEREATSVKAVTLQVTPEQAEKLALASSEGKLQLVMRSQMDQGDEQTHGVNKRNLLNGDVAMPVPDAGSLKSEQPKSEAKPVRRAPVSKPTVTAPTPQPTPRTQVEMIEGGKKRNVDFP
jgi:Flp pilus assembly protein CpaB